MAVTFNTTMVTSVPSGYAPQTDTEVARCGFIIDNAPSGTSKIKYKIHKGSNAGSWVTVNGKTANVSQWIIKHSAFTATSKTHTVTVEVNYYNSSGTKLSYEKQSTKITLPTWVKAAISSTEYTPVQINQITTDVGFIQGYSYTGIAATFTPPKNTYITSVTYSCNSLGVTGVVNNTDTTTNKAFRATYVSNKLAYQSGKHTWTLKATDSRGYTAMWNVGLNYQAYRKPTAKLTVKKCNGSGTATATGKYMSVAFTPTISSIHNNSATATIYYKKYSDDNWTTGASAFSITNGTAVTKVIGGGKLEESATYQVKVTLTDKVSSASVTTSVGDYTSIIDVNSEGGSVGIGTEANDTNGYCDVGHVLRGHSSIYTGGKAGYNDGATGVCLGKDGTIHLSGTNPNQGIWFHYANQTSGYRGIYAVSDSVIETNAGNFNCTGHLRAGGGLFSGNKQGWSAGDAGAVISDQGGIMLTSDSSTSYPGINFQYNKASTYPSIVSNSANVLEYKATNGHKFTDGNVLVNNLVTNVGTKTGSADGKMGAYISNTGRVSLTGNSSNNPAIVFYPDNSTATNTLIESDTIENMRLRADKGIRLQTETLNTDANNVYLGYNDSSEKNIHFQGTQTGASHKCKIYGGNQISTTALGVYDGHLGITVAAYADGYNSSGSQTSQPSLTINNSVNFRATGTVSSSDERLKENIHDLDDRYTTFFDNLKFKTFKYKTGNRQWTGVLAQQMKEAMDTAGITTEEFAGYVEYNIDPVEDKDIWNGYADEKGVRYEQLIAVIGNELQKEKAYSRALEERLAQIEQKLNNQEA